MRFILSNYGHRYVLHLARSGVLDQALETDDVGRLCRIFSRGILDEDESPELSALVARGMIEPAPEGMDREAARLRYDRNPLEHLRRVVFEYTTVCNLDCNHCRNSNLEAHADADPTRLRRIVDAVLPLGIGRFDFIGGEVTLYGKGWLDLVAYIRAQGGMHASVITSGWFFGERDFRAAGKRYGDDREYLGDLRARGLTHVIVSLDGPAAVHDACRGVPGLYNRVIEGLDKVRDAGLEPRVSLVVGMSTSRAETRPWMADLSRRIYGPEPDDLTAAQRLVLDESNYVSNFIDVGGGVKLRRSRTDLAAFTNEELRCKNFFRPAPTLRIKATGEIALCPLIEGGDGYGNVHERDIVELLNHMQDAFVYKLHAERRVGAHLRFVKPEIFGGSIGHACSVRVAINMIARTMHERGVSVDDQAAIHAINVEIAEKMGVLPRTGIHRANGHVRAR
ncbi:MAG TPA: radical SAM protein [Polyangium sp.]|nr:radical SAM protein [Polyangium sp.]